MLAALLGQLITTLYRGHAYTTSPEPLEGKLLASVKEQLDLLSLHTTTIQSAIDSYIKLGWRERMSTELSQLMQKRLHLLQNPKRCHRAKKLLCRISKPCGFGCQIHHVAYCFIFAYATERMLVLDSGGWRYSGKWEDVFQPLSNSCNYSESTTITCIYNVKCWQCTDVISSMHDYIWLAR